MPFATVSSKGQITLPAELRRQLGIKAHDRVNIEAANESIIIRPVGDFFELKGMLKKRGVSLDKAREEMMQAVADHVMETDQ